MKIHKSILIFLIIIINTNVALTQYSDKILEIAAEPLIEGEPINFTMEIATSTVCCNKIELAYRVYGESEFKTVEMNLKGSLATGLIPENDVTPPFIEYYVILYTTQDEIETYPLENPKLSPLKLTIKEKIFTKINWYSPSQNEKTTSTDFLIAFSIDNTDTTIDFKSTKIFIDEIDFTDNLLQTGDMFIIKPEQDKIKPGLHQIRVEIYNQALEKVIQESRSFTIITHQTGKFKLENINYNASFSLENRNENISGISNAYRRATIFANSEYSFLKLNANFYFTSEEKTYRQPQNRYFVGLEIPHLKLGFGDSYPIISNLIMSGKRVRGLTANSQLGFFKLDFIYGNIIRKIESQIQSVDSPDDPTKIYFRQEDSTWLMLIKRGEYDRNIMIIRPSFGKGENFNWGLTFLKSKDDKKSIKYGLMPKENLVLGSDIRIALDKKRIELTAQAAFSAVNNDISTGTIKDEDIDSLFKSLTESERDLIRRAKNTLSKFITVNEHITPLSLKNLTSLAYEGALSLYYFDNLLKFSYIRRGSAYESFGQAYIRKDIQGFSIIDRLRILQNRLFLSLGYEQLKDNTDNSKPATTNYTTLSSTLSYYSSGNPSNISIGYIQGFTKNNYPDPIYEINDQNNRIFIQTGFNFEYLAKNNLILNLSSSRRNDKTIRNLDTKSFTATMGLNSTFSFPLQTLVNISYTSSVFQLPTENETKSIKYTTTNISGIYFLFNKKIRLMTGIRPTFGDINRYAFDFSADYKIITRLIISGILNIYSYADKKSESVINFAIRYDI